jgi:hypothetical protein
MNKIYDKLLLAIAVLMFAVGAFLYVQKSGAAPEKGQPIDSTPANNPYQPLDVRIAEMADAEWPEPKVNSNEWLYDVFTPPKIYIDENGKLVNEPWTPPPPTPPFGIYLEQIVRKPYRIQLEGYIEEDLSDASKSLLLLYSEEAEKQVRARPGDEKADLEFKLLSFDIERVREGTNVQKIASAVILDQRSGEEVTLPHGEILLDDTVTVVIRSDEDPTFEIVLTEAPTEFEGPTGRYTLQKINLEESTVTVEKQGSEEIESEVRLLKASAVNTSKLKEKTTPVEAPAQGSEEILESIF